MGELNAAEWFAFAFAGLVFASMIGSLINLVLGPADIPDEGP